MNDSKFNEALSILANITPDQRKALLSLLENESGRTELQWEAEHRYNKTQTTSAARVNEDFKMIRGSGSRNKSEPVKASANRWVDSGEERDHNFDPSVFERTKRERTPPKKVVKQCSVCKRNFEIHVGLVYGEHPRCDRCVGK